MKGEGIDVAEGEDVKGIYVLLLLSPSTQYPKYRYQGSWMDTSVAANILKRKQKKCSLTTNNYSNTESHNYNEPQTQRNYALLSGPTKLQTKTIHN